MNLSLFSQGEEGLIDCFDLSPFQLSFLGQDGGGNLKVVPKNKSIFFGTKL